MFTPLTVVNFEGFLMRKLRFLRKKARFTDQISKTRYFSTCFCFTICFSNLQKNINGNTRHFSGTLETLEVTITFSITYFSSFKMRLPNGVSCVKGQRKMTFAKFCSKNSIKKQLVVPEYHTFLIVFTRIARNVISLSFTLTTVSGKRFCTKQIVTKPDTAKSLQNKRNFKSSTHTCHQTCLYIFLRIYLFRKLDEKTVGCPKVSYFFHCIHTNCSKHIQFNVTLTTISGKRLCTK